LVSFAGEPAVVPVNLIASMRQRIGEIANAGGELFDGLKTGDTVVVQAGPFDGYEAIYDTRLPGEERVRVLLIMLADRYVPVELPAGQIHKKKNSHNLNIKKN